jgi:Flp pilus assembly protein TadG
VSTFGFDRLLRNRRGNVAMMYALVAPILVFSGGAAVDYGRAAQIRTKLNAAADAAALAALTPAMLQQSSDVAQTAATNMFHGLADGLPGLTAAPQVTVSVATDPISLKRSVSLTYSSSVNTIFAQVLGKSALPIGGMSQASAQAPPNIDFYVLLDNSPSMALPATSAGITQMESLTTNSYNPAGCAFACHQADTGTDQTDTIYNPCTDGTSPTVAATINGKKWPNAYCDTTKHGAQLDNYALARKNNIALRLDELNSGVSTLLQTASTSVQSSTFASPPVYRFSIDSMDNLWKIGLSQLMPLIANYTSGWTSASASFGVMEMYSNNNTCGNAACSAACTGSTKPACVSGDVGTNYDDSLGTLSKASSIPNPGNGTNQSGDTPQEVLFIVTDGVEDEQSGSRRLEQTINDLAGDPSPSPYGNVKGTNWCTTIKNRGIKIAILYTDYLRVPANNWYNTHIDPFQPQIGADLQACATPGLFIDEANDADIGADLAKLFNLASAPGHLTQ